MFNPNDVVGKQSCPRSTYERNDNNYTCHALFRDITSIGDDSCPLLESWSNHNCKIESSFLSFVNTSAARSNYGFVVHVRPIVIFGSELPSYYTGQCNSHGSLPKIKGALLVLEASSNLIIHFTNHANGSSNAQVLTWEVPNRLSTWQCSPSIRSVQLSVLAFCQQYMLLLPQSISQSKPVAFRLIPLLTLA
jgi:hypothetical protein